jgi:hypothetical protein
MYIDYLLHPGTGVNADFCIPSGLWTVFDTSGVPTFYVGDMFNRRIRKLSNTGIVTTIAGSGTNGRAVRIDP